MEQSRGRVGKGHRGKGRGGTQWGKSRERSRAGEGGRGKGRLYRDGIGGCRDGCQSKEGDSQWEKIFIKGQCHE